MPNDTPKLKPCPCCGGLAEIRQLYERPTFAVFCSKCGLRAEWRNKKSTAITNWERRIYE